MKDLILENIHKIIEYMVFHDGCSICNAAKSLEMSREEVRKIILLLYQQPFGGIFIYYDNYKDIDEPDTIHPDIMDKVLKWHIDPSRMDPVPIKGFIPEELTMLSGILKGLTVKTIRHKTKIASGAKYPQPALSIRRMDINERRLSDYCFYDEIQKAIVQQVGIKVIYSSPEEQFSLVLFPLGLVYSAEQHHWYLAAQSENGFIYPYKLERIKKVEATHQCFTFPEGFVMEDYAKNVWGMEVSDGEFIKILFKDEGNVIEKAGDKLAGKGILTHGDGAVIFEGKIHGINYFKSWLRGFGSSIVVLEPAWLRAEMIDSCKKIIENYQNIEKYIEEIYSK